MGQEEAKVVLITGASHGIGRACATRLHRGGHRVYGTSREPERWSDLSTRQREIGTVPYKLIRMDVDDDASVARGVEAVLEAEGRLDVVVNNAGFGLAGAVEDTSMAEAKAQFETNFFGAVRVCRQVLPVMRAAGRGLIVNVSSIAGRIPVPFQALYSASKFALEGFTEALRTEVRPFGLRIVLIEPGDFHTTFTANRRVAAAAGESSPYHPPFRRALRVMEEDELGGPLPERIAALLEHLLDDPHPRLRYTAGPFAERLAALLRPALPDRLVEWGIAKYYHLP